MTGVERISAVFEAKKKNGAAAFMPYHAMGYPDRAKTLEIVSVLAEEGADLFEIGIPFSDPLADGPVIQAATYTALTQGTTVADSLAMVSELREQGVDQPFCAMTYYNPIFSYGIERFVEDAAASGIDGLIIPDLPPEEGDEIEAACRKAGLAIAYFLAPTSTEERIKMVAQRATGFIYVVSITGITGARKELPKDLTDTISRIRKHTDLPLAVGFGIGTREQAATVAAIADGVIVGSALVKAGAEGGIEPVRDLGAELATGSHNPA